MKIIKTYYTYLNEKLTNESQLFKYLNMSQEDKYIDFAFKSTYLLQNFIDTIDPDDYGITQILTQYDEDDFNELIYEFENYESNINHKNFLIDFGEYCEENIHEWYDIPANFALEYPKKEKEQWLLYSTKDSSEASDIWREGFEYGEDDFEKLHLRNNNTYKSEYGHYIGYNIDDFDRYGEEYVGWSYKLKHGKELLMFRSTGIHVRDFSREEDVTIFNGRSAYNIIWLESDDEHYYIESRLTRKKLIEKDSYIELIRWVEENFDQYKKHLESDKFEKLEAKRIRKKKNKKSKRFNL